MFLPIDDSGCYLNVPRPASNVPIPSKKSNYGRDGGIGSSDAGGVVFWFLVKRYTSSPPATAAAPNA